MKSIIKILVIVMLTLSTSQFFAQPPNPNSGNDPSGGNNTVNGGGAPIGSGLFILLGLGAAYGGRKTYKFYQDKKESLEF